jgi:Uri superfamily endonuclease
MNVRHRPPPAEKGTYLLILHLAAPQLRLRIGRLGSFDFAAGYYLYVGSAYGAGGLSARLAYHQQQHKRRPHWHIDYLRVHAPIREIWTVSCDQRLEHAWVAALQRVAALRMPVRRFGASDTTLPAHLFYTPDPPAIATLSRALLAAVPLAEPQVRWLRFAVYRLTTEH